MNIKDRVLEQMAAVRTLRLKPTAINIGYLAAAQLHQDVEDGRKEDAERDIPVDGTAINIVGAKFCGLLLQLSERVAPDEVKVVFDGWGFKVGDVVTVTTSTVFDAEGVPVSIPKGARGRVTRIDEKFAQVEINWGHGREEMGVPLEHVG